MFNIGDIIQVKEKGHRAKIIRIDEHKVWVIWDSFPGREVDYKKHEAYPFWELATGGAKSSNSCSHVWHKYLGITHKYEYCSKCNIKKTS